MGLFRDAQDVYDCIGRIFQEAISDPEIGPKTKEAGLTMRFDFKEPESIIYVDFAQGDVFFGDDVPDRVVVGDARCFLCLEAIPFESST